MKDGIGVQWSDDLTARRLSFCAKRAYCSLVIPSDCKDLLPETVRNSDCYRFSIAGEECDGGYEFPFKNLRTVSG